MDNRDYTRVLLYSYSTTITGGWGPPKVFGSLSTSRPIQRFDFRDAVLTGVQAWDLPVAVHGVGYNALAKLGLKFGNCDRKKTQVVEWQ